MTKRYDCTAGGYQFCSGCYQMEESELGDYVSHEDYALLLAALKSALADMWSINEFLISEGGSNLDGAIEEARAVIEKCEAAK